MTRPNDAVREALEQAAKEGDRVRKNAVLIAHGMPHGAERQKWESHANGADEVAHAIRAIADELPETPVSETAPHDRGAMIERVAKALCKHAYPMRTLDEYMAPSRELWMRLIPEAEVAVDAMRSTVGEEKSK